MWKYEHFHLYSCAKCNFPSSYCAKFKFHLHLFLAIHQQKSIKVIIMFHASGFFMCVFLTIFLSFLHARFFSTCISSVSQKHIPLFWQLMVLLFISDQRSDASRVNLVKADGKVGIRKKGELYALTLLVRVSKCDWSRCEQTGVYLHQWSAGICVPLST